VIEGFSRGVPVLASDIPTLREVGGSAAAYADPGQPAAWADTVRRLSRSVEVRETMRRAGLERAAEMTYAHTAAATMGVLRSAAKTRR
jgi:glycosyltransferase involved in cell wall biosynthesis